MQSEDKVLNWIKEKFPNQNENIDHLFKNDAHFYELCLDYHLCMQNLQRFGENTEDGFWIHEYKELYKDLENELTWLISKSSVAASMS